MTNHTTLTEWDEMDGCPVHGNAIRKTYYFGRYRDAELVTFQGCHCAVCINAASLQCGVPLGTEYTYHTSYANASGRARLIAALENVKNAPFEMAD